MRADTNNNLSERLQGTYRSRIKTLRGLDGLESGQRYLDGWTLTYNLFREHESLGDKTPGSKAHVGAPFKEWADVVRERHERVELKPPKTTPQVTLSVPSPKAPKTPKPKADTTPRTRLNPIRPSVSVSRAGTVSASFRAASVEERSFKSEHK